MVGRHLTLMFAENNNCAGMLDGSLVSQIRAYKQGAAIGYRVVSTTWRREAGIGLPTKAAASKVSVTSAHVVPLPKGHKQVAAAVEQVLGQQWSARLSGGNTTAIAAYELPDGRRTVHVVNYAAEPAKGLKLTLGPKWSGAGKARLLTAEGPEQMLDLGSGTPVSVDLPPLAVYAIVVLPV